jgi:uncharacterized protein (TIGR00661 family)
MRILYGINGTGNGHITKSVRVIERITSMGHRVDTLVSGANKNLTPPLKIDFEMRGFTFKYTAGGVDMFSTILGSSITGFMADLGRLDLSGYDLVISDFEPVTAWASKFRGARCVGISHQHSFLSPRVPRPKDRSRLAEAFLRWFSPVSDHAGIHFERYDEDIYQPIIRKEISQACPKDGGHVTVYLPSHDPTEVMDSLDWCDREFHVFCASPPPNVGRFSFRRLDLGDFTESLVSCNTVVTAAGFETPAESLLLGKKLIVLPIYGQYEQSCNAAALEKLGVRVVRSISDLKDLCCDQVPYDWVDPIDDIVNHVLG